MLNFYAYWAILSEVDFIPHNFVYYSVYLGISIIVLPILDVSGVRYRFLHVYVAFKYC